MNRMNRRDMLKTSAGLAAWLTSTRPGDLTAQALNIKPRGTARTCIFVYLNGAPSHLDTFDVKDAEWNPPDAAIQQNGQVVLSTTLFPRLFAQAGELCLLRSVKSWEAAHERGVYYLQTAHPQNPAFVTETPHLGAIVSLEKAGSGPLPPFLAPNSGGVSMQGAKFLGGEYAPLAVPASQGGLGTLEHNHFGNQSQARFLERYALLEQLDADMRTQAPDVVMSDHAAFYTSARRMVYAPEVASVFRFTADDNTRYGNTNLGRGAIVARNAVRARNGAAFVALNHNGWDTHSDMFNRGVGTNMYSLCRELDTAIGSLVEDLRASGDLDQTLIVMMGEFGRTPGPLNNRGGRDHHRDAMSVVMIGGGVRGGRVIGATDRNGDQIIEPGWSLQRPIYMEDIAATVLSALGINWTKSLTDTPSGRKFEYVSYAENGTYVPVEEVFG